MPDTWGSSTLHITEYGRPAAEIIRSRKKLIPDPADTTYQEIVMGCGRCRKERVVKGYGDVQEVDAMEADMYACIKRMVSFSDGFSMNAVIWQLKADRQKGADVVWYECTFLET